MSRLIAIPLLSAALLLPAGCRNGDERIDSLSGTLIGAGVGAGAGSLLGGNTESTVAGALIGGTAGYAYGRDREDRNSDYRNEDRYRRDRNDRRRDRSSRHSGRECYYSERRRMMVCQD